MFSLQQGLYENEKYREKLENQNFKNPKEKFCDEHWEENSGEVWKNSKVI